MSKYHLTILSALLAAIIPLTGCGASATAPANNSASAEGSAYRLDVEPADAKDVKAAKEVIKDEEEITLVGRVGGDVNPWIEGQAAFLIVDRALKPCNEKDDDACPTPWDYCCDADSLPEHKAMVKVVDGSGKTVSTDARKLLGLKELQTVVVHGKAKRDDAGNLTVLADGVFVRN
ncbi:MAG TPA: hypothetical protein VFV87_12595 [Pirellulaceae bacterium]|nr:hypothetical protein [Pirellulaceae bacterium]